MNYFAHGYRFIDAPYVLAGTAVPDWLSVVNRKARARGRLAQPYLQNENRELAELARGIVQHHHDDAWFHQTRAFAELSLSFTRAIRERLPDDEGFRPSFLGHILVELLLDAELIAHDPRRLDDYYRALDGLDPHLVGRAVDQMTTRPTGMLPLFIPRFSAERFLYDYLDDGKLLVRLNHVMRRVKLAKLPTSLAEFFPEARQHVHQRKAELLEGPGQSQPQKFQNS